MKSAAAKYGGRRPPHTSSNICSGCLSTSLVERATHTGPRRPGAIPTTTPPTRQQFAAHGSYARPQEAVAGATPQLPLLRARADRICEVVGKALLQGVVHPPPLCYTLSEHTKNGKRNDHHFSADDDNVVALYEGSHLPNVRIADGASCNGLQQQQQQESSMGPPIPPP